MSRSRAQLVLSTAGSLREARKMAEVLIAERLAACVNLVPGVQSHYRWKGKVESSREVILLIKTTARRYAALEKRLRDIHSYQVPEIISVPVSGGSRDYLRWIDESTRDRRP